MTRRFFTVHQANRALPLVRRVIDDLTEKYQELTQLRDELRKAGPEKSEDLEREARALENRIQDFLAELDSVGCELKDVHTGLLDFYAKKGEETIYLCWRRGEEQIDWWHSLEGGFRGRRSISELPQLTLGEE